jgi:hypothetical protein
MHKTRKTKTSLLTPYKFVNRTYHLPLEAVIALEELTIRLSEQSNIRLSLGKVLGLIINYTKNKSTYELLDIKKLD